MIASGAEQPSALIEPIFARIAKSRGAHAV